MKSLKMKCLTIFMAVFFAGTAFATVNGSAASQQANSSSHNTSTTAQTQNQHPKVGSSGPWDNW